MANAPDANVLREIIELLKMRVQNGAATFLVKVKAHRGEPLNELADSLAEAAREVGMEKIWICFVFIGSPTETAVNPSRFYISGLPLEFDGMV
jgi:hypothetical protein